VKHLFIIKNKIKHADWPYILQSFFIYFFVVGVGYILFSGPAFMFWVVVATLLFLVTNSFHIYRLQVAEREVQQYKFQCLQEIYRLLPVRAPLPPMVSWAATPELSVAIFRVIQKYRPVHIVELGGGISTLICAYSHESLNVDGTIISFDHDPRFAAKTISTLEEHSLSDRVDVRTAPLSKILVRDDYQTWYNSELLHFDAPIDLLVIDGPPFSTQQNARYPAMPLLYKHLNDQAVIIMHDTKRKNEAATIKQWCEEYKDLEVEHLYSEKGITLIKKGY